MHWKNEYKINIPIIDAQHKQLFLIYGQLGDELHKGMKAEIIQNTLIKLQHYVSRHFAMEEKYMSEYNYPKLAEQQQAHNYFSQRFTEIFKDFKENGLSPQIVQAIRNELKDWQKKHIVTLDMEFGRYYHSP